MSRACINYGHGQKDVGYDPGAIGPTGYQEATQNKDVGELVVAKLRANSWDILSIQDGDLEDVTNQSNTWGANYFLSIHANSFADPSAHGIETVIIGRGGVGEEIAIEIQKELVLATRLTDRGVKVDNLHVLRETDCPAALIEIGFISNPVEENLMKQDSWDELVASAICRGFSRAVGVAYTEPSTTEVAMSQSESDKDIYLSVRVLQSKSEDVIKQIVAMGHACKVLPLA